MSLELEEKIKKLEERIKDLEDRLDRICPKPPQHDGLNPYPIGEE